MKENLFILQQFFAKIGENDMEDKFKSTIQEKRCLACRHSKIEGGSQYFPPKHGGYGCELQDYLPVSKVKKCPLEKE